MKIKKYKNLYILNLSRSDSRIEIPCNIFGEQGRRHGIKSGGFKMSGILNMEKVLNRNFITLQKTEGVRREKCKLTRKELLQKVFEIQLKVSYSISLESLTVNTICKDTFFSIKIVSFGWLRMKYSKKLIQVKDENILDMCLKLVETKNQERTRARISDIFQARVSFR